jgi:hypothetical protein
MWDVFIYYLTLSLSFEIDHKVCNLCYPKVGWRACCNLCFAHLYSLIDLQSISNNFGPFIFKNKSLRTDFVLIPRMLKWQEKIKCRLESADHILYTWDTWDCPELQVVRGCFLKAWVLRNHHEWCSHVKTSLENVWNQGKHTRCKIALQTVVIVSITETNGTSQMGKRKNCLALAVACKLWQQGVLSVNLLVLGCQWVPSTPPHHESNTKCCEWSSPDLVASLAMALSCSLTWLSLAIKLPNLIQLMQRLSKVSS